MAKIGLKKFIARAAKSKLFEGTPAGDFIGDAFRDKKFKNYKKWDDLDTHLIGRSAHFEVRRAGKAVFNMWEKTFGAMED